MAENCREPGQLEPEADGSGQGVAPEIQIVPAEASVPKETSLQDSAIAKIREESAKKALLLKRKELKWKLMQASQTQNRAKLEEVRAEANYHKLKMTKSKNLAVKLRAKYLKMVKLAKLSESQHKSAEARMLTQEKFVADEKMQLTKLALDCMKTGAQLYGTEYKLPTNSNMTKTKTSPRNLSQSSDNLVSKLEPFLKSSRMDANKSNQGESRPAGSPTKKKKLRYVKRLSSLYDMRDSLFHRQTSCEIPQSPAK